MAADAKIILARVLRLLAPPERVPLSQWADEHRHLSSEASAAPGPWRTLPFQREPLDVIAAGSLFETVVLVWASQLGKSELLMNFLANIIPEEPGPCLLVEPTLAMCEAFSKDRIAPLFRDTPILRGKVAEPKSREAGSTIFHRRFLGGHLTMVGSNSPSGLAARPIRYLLLDEVDRYEESAGAEGDPVALAMARTRTFWNRKIVMTSSPTIRGASRIENAWEESDKREFEVPCPLAGCGHYQQLKWDRVEWPEGQPEEAAYRCAGCGELIPHHLKDGMVAGGRWRATAKSPKVAGFHLSELISPWRSWGDLAADWLKAQGQPERMRVFTNVSLAEWTEQAAMEIPEAQTLMIRAEPFSEGVIPQGGCLLVAGVDVQPDRLEMELVAFGHDYESWSIHFFVIYGSISEPEVWNRLDELLGRSWPHASGMPMQVQACCIDSGFATPEVCSFTRARHGRRIYSTKGLAGGWGRPIWPRKASWTKDKYAIYGVSSDEAKLWTATRLKIDKPGPGYLHFPAARSRDWYEQLTCEKLVIDRGQRRWVNPLRSRNEATDARALAVCALHSRLLAGVDLNTYCQQFEQMLAPAPLVNGTLTPPQQVIRSKFIYG